MRDLSYLPTREPPAPLSGNAFVYILACSDGALYVGSAGDVAKRLAEHGGPKGAKVTRDHPGGRLVAEANLEDVLCAATGLLVLLVYLCHKELFEKCAGKPHVRSDFHVLALDDR